MHWRPNLFMIPKCNESNEFVLMLSRLFDTACDANDHEGIPLIEASLLCKLVLQKFASRKFDTLYEEEKVLQTLLRTSQPMWHPRGWINDFSRLMTVGKTTLAERILKKGAAYSSISVSSEGIDILDSPIGPKPFIDGWIENKARVQPISRTEGIGVRVPTKIQDMEHHWSSSVCQAMNIEVHNEEALQSALTTIRRSKIYL
ncbi:hypothetical protein GJ496_009493 [Pomphorhynchus laevis]|nr:hypothetical protein GJ496_009493 [Pomphorhynchus laevis]